MKIRIADIVNDSIVDGPGIRLAVFTQGCFHNCEGCHNAATHDFYGGRLIDTDDIIQLVKKNPLLSGVTFSGGEPLLQPEAVTEAAREIKRMNLTVWIYTGFTWEEILQSENKKVVLKYTDVLVDGRFEKDKKTLDLAFAGSYNQRVIDVKRSVSHGEIHELESCL
ncbi:MAG: anaerobic ribonucleoside-triphosphate reductase activating protein [Clostridiales bacterium]|jgi:anaerobic ribonucleoside-triphosphate reductase activating protein|nr:anaerobic ribonucleoside-triphosphate reductase activating protein [Clostridiales bacterium]